MSVPGRPSFDVFVGAVGPVAGRVPRTPSAARLPVEKEVAP